VETIVNNNKVNCSVTPIVRIIDVDVVVVFAVVTVSLDFINADRSLRGRPFVVII